MSQDQSAEMFDEIQRRISVLEERNLELVEEARRSEGEKRFVEGELIRLQKELKRLKAELERLKTPPLIIGQIKDMLADGRVVVKSSTGPDFVVSTSDYVAPELLVAGARVALAWVLKHPARIIPILGTGVPDEMRSSAQAEKLALTRQQSRAEQLGSDGHFAPARRAA